MTIQPLLNFNNIADISQTIADEDLVRISPLMHQHLIPNGTYHFARSKPGDEIA